MYIYIDVVTLTGIFSKTKYDLFLLTYYRQIFWQRYSRSLYAFWVGVASTRLGKLSKL